MQHILIVLHYIQKKMHLIASLIRFLLVFRVLFLQTTQTYSSSYAAFRKYQYEIDYREF